MTAPFAYIQNCALDGSMITGTRRVYHACRAGIEGREDVAMLSEPDTTTPYQRRFVENFHWNKYPFPSSGILLLDIIPLLDAQTEDEKQMWSTLFAGVKNFDMVLTISQWAKQTIVEHLGVPEGKIKVALCGYDKATFKPLKVDREKWLAQRYLPTDKKIIGHVSASYERKNIRRILEALAMLPEEYVFVKPSGADNTIRAWAKELGIKHRVLSIDRQTDEALAEFYNVMDVFCLPSLSEGFGLPALEAQACGTPTVLSSTTAMPELAGEGAVQVDPMSSEDIARGILEAEKMGRHKPSKAFTQKFNWKNTGKVVNEWLSEGKEKAHVPG